MRNYGDQTRFEKDVTNEPNRVGEFPPTMGSQTTGWDSLKEVPFRGSNNAFAKAASKQNTNTSSVSHNNAFKQAGASQSGKTNSMTQQRSR